MCVIRILSMFHMPSTASKIFQTINNFKFSDILRPKTGLIDPSPLSVQGKLSEQQYKKTPHTLLNENMRNNLA